MHQSTFASPLRQSAIDVAPLPPKWAREWVRDAASQQASVDDITVEIVNGSLATLVSVRISDARHMSEAAFRDKVLGAHSILRKAILSSPHRQIVRIWNHLPGIHDAIGESTDRYMAFNAARFDSMRIWFGAGAEFRKSVPAASGVGHAGDDLLIHALAVTAPGRPIENPQQIPPYQYSQYYGPMPPCFARATRIDHPHRALLISGTAAIRGEQTQFADDLERQWNLTLENLRTVITNGWPVSGDAIQLLRDVRIYVPPATSITVIQALARASFGPSVDIEWVRADLCRRDLLVEIEGMVCEEQAHA